MPKMVNLQDIAKIARNVAALEKHLLEICEDRDMCPYEMHHDTQDFKGTLYCIGGMYIVLAKKVRE